MIRLHHLIGSRSQRILWLLEESDLPYELIRYSRDADGQSAPPSLRAIHPLGRSPVIEDDGSLIAESGAIVEHICRRHRPGYTVLPSSKAWPAYLEFLHSPMLAFTFGSYAARQGDTGRQLAAQIAPQIGETLTYLSDRLSNCEWFLEDRLTAVDFMLMIPLLIAMRTERIAGYPTLAAYLGRIMARPAWNRAMAAGL